MELTFNELTPQNPYLELFGQLFDHLPLGISVHDVNNVIVYYNRALAAIDDMEPAEVIGRPINEVFRPFDSKGLLSQRCMDTRRHFLNHHLFYYTRLGKLVNSIHHVFPLTRGNRLLGCICFVEAYKEPSMLPELPAENKSRSDVNPADRGGHYTFDQIITRNPNMQRAIEVTARSADSDSAIMIYGETGCGKEMFAQAAHHCSRRAKKPFLAVSCAAIPENLLEGLLFGTVKGAFTGAQDRPGLMEMADGGTLFLDEINSMPLGLQSKMLRAIQEQTVNRIGGSKERTVSLKIISATNNHPHRAVTEGQLRPDLLYRLGVVIVEIPPLRNRKDDLEPLTNHFIMKFNKRLGKNIDGLSPAMQEAFDKHYWPGNVRELEHVIESAMNLVSNADTTLEASHFTSSLFKRNSTGGSGFSANTSGRPWASTAGQDASTTPQAWSSGNEISGGWDQLRPETSFDNSAQPERRAGAADLRSLDPDESARLVKALEAAGGNVARAARSLNISPQLMHHRLKKYGLKKRIIVKMEAE